jgi:hypothetical protein
MDTKEQLEQRMWEYVYDLLSDDEANALEAQITSEPDVARVYAEVKLQSERVAAAAKLEMEQVELQRPADREVAATTEPSMTRASRVAPAASLHSVNWLVGLAAAALLMITGYTYLKPDSPLNPQNVALVEQKIADRHVRTVVTGPEKLQLGVTNSFSVSTTDAKGTPQIANVEYRLYDSSGNLQLERSAKTDENGTLQVELSPTVSLQNARLQIDTNGVATLTTHLQADEIHHATQLSLDKPLYQPGEMVYYRSLTLSRFGLQDDREFEVQFEMLNPAGAMIAESQLYGVTDHGVGNGAFQIPPHFPGGKYTLLARSPRDEFPEEKRDFFVRRYRVPRLKKQLEFVRDSYAPGDTVVADFSAERAEGGAVAGANLRIVVTIDQQSVDVPTPEAKTSDDGTYQVKFQLPEQIEKGDGTLAVIVDDGGNQETMAKTIPINLGKVEVHFYPEGGDLVAGLENRVYFYAHDPLDKPVHVEGRVVDGKNKEVAKAETGHEGRGAFRFTPAEGEKYTLQITSPAGVTSQPQLPAASNERFVVIDADAGVFQPGKPIELLLRTKKDAPLAIAAVCRGAQVGQIDVPASGDKPQAVQTRNVTVPLTPEAEGVIRLTVYDYSKSPPQPIAERLVYRRPARKLNVRVADHEESYSPGDSASLSLYISDEQGNPVSAALGVAVVDEALLSLAEDKTPRMPTHFLLTTEIENPQDLEDANFYLSDKKDATAALDLLLGTQGWRRFVELSVDQLVEGRVLRVEGRAGVAAESAELLALADSLEDETQAARAEALGRLLAMDNKAGPPLLYDNLPEVQKEYSSALSSYHASREQYLKQSGQLAFFGAVALMVVLAMTMLMRLTSGVKVWLPALSAATACLIIGGLWMGARVEQDGQIALAPFTSFGVRGESQRELVRADMADEAESGAAESKPADEAADKAKQDGLARNENRALLAAPAPAAPPALDAALPAEPQAAAFEAALSANAKREAAGAMPGGERMARGGQMLADDAREGLMRARRQMAGKDFFDKEFLEKNADRFAGGGGFGYRANARDLAELQGRLRKAAEIGNMREAVELAQQLGQSQSQLRFPVRQYAHQHPKRNPGDPRTDFAETLAWFPLLIADQSGRATIRFDLSDSVTTFRVLADAHAGGRIGTGQGQIISRIPFSLEPKLPLEVNAGDRIDLPLAVNNDTHDKLPVEVSLKHSNLLKLANGAQRKIQLAPRERQREYYSLDVVGQTGDAELEFRGTAGDLSDAIKKSIKVVPPGFPVAQSYGGQIEGEQELSITLPEQWVPGSLEVSLQAFPSSLADLQKGVDSILREPSGCFEQTSSSNYPNVLALQYMQQHDVADPQFTRRAKDLLTKGYGKLVSFECPKKGYEWFGGDPGHEALTAYGLMEFRDMSQVWDVDPQMIERTAQWLMKRRDGKGGFERNSRALDSFGSAPQDITDAYIVWALSEAKQPDIAQEIDHVIRLAEKSDDPYLIALAAAAAINAGDREKTGDELLKKLAEQQKEDGHLEAKNGSITRSGGLSLNVETTALAALAWLKRPQGAVYSNKAIEWITKSRQGAGGFGSTQATILALKALVAHTQANRKTINDGALVLKGDDTEIGRTPFKAGEKHAIELAGIAGQLKSGDNKLTINLTGDNKMPYVMDISYRTFKPASDEKCPVRLSTKLAAATVKSGETLGLTVELANISDKGQPMTVAIVGLPAGLEARTQQLEDLKKSGKFDYYEVNARELIFYWRSLGPDVKGDAQISFALDLIAEIPGHYTGPASRAYLYYTAEQKHWTDPLSVEITRE